MPHVVNNPSWRLLVVAGLLGMAALHGAEPGTATSLDDLRQDFAHPGKAWRPMPLNTRGLSQMTTGQLTDFIVKPHWGGLLFRHPGGPKGYLQDAGGWHWFEESMDLLAGQGLTAWIYDETEYPSGRAGGLVLEGHAELEAQGLFYAAKDVAVDAITGGTAIAWTLPPGKPFLVVRQALAPSGSLTGPQVDLADTIQGDTLRTTIPSGRWRLMAFTQDRLYAGTHASVAAPSPFPNILDPAATQRFLDTTYEAYHAHCGRHFGKTITAIFNDEVSLMSGYITRATPPHPVLAWYHGLPELFRKRNGYDIRLCLPAQFNEVGFDTVPMRCAFRSLLGDQVAEGFFKPVHQWCAHHGVASTGHLFWEESLIYHACFYGSVFPAYRQLDWPGIDVLGCQFGRMCGSHTEGGPVTPKLASSVAHLEGKARVMSESFCFVNDPVKMPIDQLMAHYGWQAALGINALVTISIQHAYPAADLARLNDYAARINRLLTRGRFAADVAMLYPIASVWADLVPTTTNLGVSVDTLHDRDHAPAVAVDKAWRDLSSRILAEQRDFDYLDEVAIQAATVREGHLVLNGNAYRILVLPHVTTLAMATLERLREFMDAGGQVVAWQTKPTHRADAGPIDAFHLLVDILWARSDHLHQVQDDDGLDRALASCGEPDLRIAPVPADIYVHHRILDSGHIYFLHNNSIEPVTRTCIFRAKGRAEIFDPLDGRTQPVTDAGDQDHTAVTMTIPARRGLFVVITRP